MNFSETGDTLYCLFSGRLDWMVSSEIERELLRRVSDFKEGRESVHLTFDLSEVVYVSSAFLRLCLICYKIVGKNSFNIINASDDIHSVFSISGFAEMMNVSLVKRTPVVA
ncbi:MAG: STAS domain-containing protein [Planctomycetaceae bacterium]|jgi:anti-anti-sigma regulatory factor|nr:STAS domain-containing protein [Planctomycetaceae bacterium]